MKRRTAGGKQENTGPQHCGRSLASLRERMENMKPKIENVKINGIRRADSAIHEFIEVLKELEVGQSFTYDLKSNHRLAIQIAARCSRIAAISSLLFGVSTP